MPRSDDHVGKVSAPGTGRFAGIATFGFVTVTQVAVPFLGLLGLFTIEWAPLVGLDHGIADYLNHSVANPPPAVLVLEIGNAEIWHEPGMTCAGVTTVEV